MTPPEALRARALDLLSRGDMAGGIAGLEAHLAAAPDDAGAWLALGAAHAAEGRWAAAAPALARAVERGGGEVEARLAYARALVRLGRLDDAAAELRQAAAMEPPDARVLRELGIVLYDQRRHDEAARWLARACDAAPEDGRAAFALGLAHEARRDIAAAIAAYREAVRRAPGFTDARLTLADALASIGEHEQALGELEALLARERSHEKAAHNREVLRRALAEMRARRLLGKTERELARSALVVEAQLRRRDAAEAPAAGGGAARQVVRYTAPLLELHVTLDPARGPGGGGGVIEALHLALTDPERAARSEDDVFKVAVIGEDGRQAPVNYATGASLTFLREALGCPMTQASALYASLLQGAPSVDWGGATARLASVPGAAGRPGGERHGILVSRRG
ncbi:tetratricopeptide repeat protein [Sorangium sp. So ce1335]|uniref:tetratricopeptide repeat protein n=1 Tax=Sorangium sp. So ce1335 TaxID=3133335 RepID=UPI003F644832